METNANWKFQTKPMPDILNPEHAWICDGFACPIPERPELRAAIATAAAFGAGWDGRDPGASSIQGWLHFIYMRNGLTIPEREALIPGPPKSNFFQQAEKLKFYIDEFQGYPH